MSHRTVGFKIFFFVSNLYKLAVIATTANSSSSSLIDSKADFTIFACMIMPPPEINFPNDNHSYADHFAEKLDKYGDEYSKKSGLKIATEILDLHYDEPCKRVYDKLLRCFERYQLVLNSTWSNNFSLLIFGPWCTVEAYEASLIRVRKLFFSDFTNSNDIAIITTNPVLMPVAGDGRLIDPDKVSTLNVHKYARTLMFIAGTTIRSGEAVRYLLGNHFQFHHVALVSIGEEYSPRLLYCDRLFDMVRLWSHLQTPRLDTSDYKWLPTPSDNDDFWEVWETLKNVVRVMVVCSNSIYTLKLIEQIELDRAQNTNKYGVFVILRSGDIMDFYVDELRKMGAIKALSYVKFLVPQVRRCSNRSNRIEPLINDKNNGLPLLLREEYATVNSFYVSMKCALRNYYEMVGKFAGAERVASKFAETYEADSETLISREGRAKQWLPIWLLYSEDADGQLNQPVLRIDWERASNTVIPKVTQLQPILWYGTDQPLSDAPFVCNNVSSSLAVVLLVAVTAIPIRYYVHHNRRYLMKKYYEPYKNVQFNKYRIVSHRPLLGKFGKASVLLLSIEAQASPNEALSASFLMEIDRIASVSESNSGMLQRILGFVVCESRDVKLVFALGLGSTLKKILSKQKLSTDLKYSLARDLCVALTSVHQSRMKVHGDLRNDRCIVDERFVLRIMLSRLPRTSAGVLRKNAFQQGRFSQSLWTAPELIRNPSLIATQASDVYSVGILLQEIAYQRGPFFVESVQGKKHGRKKITKTQSNLRLSPEGSDKSSQMSNDESCAEFLVNQVKRETLRPSIDFVGGRNALRKISMLETLMERCWNENPESRPKISDVLLDLENYIKTCQIDIARYTAKRLQAASKQMVKGLLEDKREAVLERDNAIKYLTHMMPPSIGYEYMKSEGNKIKPELCEQVTIYFNDLVDFALINEHSTKAVSVLDELFRVYDKTVALYDVMPLHRVGSSLLLASGVPNRTPHHATEVALAALHIRQFAKQFARAQTANNQVELRIRAGIHSGPVMCGVVGRRVPQYGLFGDTVNTASRMASTGRVDEIQISDRTFALLRGNDNFDITGGEWREVKGKGRMQTYWLKGFNCRPGAAVTDGRLDAACPPRRQNKEDKSFSSQTTKTEGLLKAVDTMQTLLNESTTQSSD